MKIRVFGNLLIFKVVAGAAVGPPPPRRPARPRVAPIGRQPPPGVRGPVRSLGAGGAGRRRSIRRPRGPILPRRHGGRVSGVPGRAGAVPQHPRAQ
jgi:hypothetical protein